MDPQEQKSTENSFSLYLSEEGQLNNFSTMNDLYILQSAINQANLQKEKGQIKISLLTKKNRELQTKLENEVGKKEKLMLSYEEKNYDFGQIQQKLENYQKQNQKLWSILTSIPQINGRPSIQKLLSDFRQLSEQCKKTEKQIQKLHDQVNYFQSLLKEEKERHESERDQYAVEIRKLKSQNSKDFLNHKLQNEVEELKEGKMEGEKQLIILEKKLIMVEEENCQIRSLLNEKRRELHKREQYILYNTNEKPKQCEKLELKELSNKLSEEIKKNNELRMNISSLNNKIAILNAQLKAEKNDKEYSSEKYNNLMLKYNELIQKLSEQSIQVVGKQKKEEKRTIQCLIQQTQEQEEEIKEKMNKFIQISQENRKLRKEIVSLKIFVEEKASQSEKQKKFIYKQTNQLNEAQKRIIEIMKENLSMKREKQYLQEEVHHYENKIIRLQSNLGKMKKEKQEMEEVHGYICPMIKAEKMRLEKQKKDLEEQKKILMQKYEKVHQEQLKWDKKIMMIDQELKRLNKGREEQREKNKELRNQILRMKEEQNKRTMEYLSKMSTLEFLLEKQKGENQFLKTQAATTQRKPRELNLSKVIEKEEKSKVSKKQEPKRRAKSARIKNESECTIDGVIEAYRRQNKELINKVKFF